MHTRQGLKPIEDIKVGDEVKSTNPQTGETSCKPVTQTHINRFSPVGTLSLLDETDRSETHLSVTNDHPFYHAEKGWVHASRLMVGDKLVEDDGGTLTVTTVLFDPNAPINVTYNLSVADFHTYYVGEDGVLVHNGKAWDAFRLVMEVMRISFGDEIGFMGRNKSCDAANINLSTRPPISAPGPPKHPLRIKYPPQATNVNVKWTYGQ